MITRSRAAPVASFPAKFHPEKLEKELQEMGRLMNWDANRIPAEASPLEILVIRHPRMTND